MLTKKYSDDTPTNKEQKQSGGGTGGCSDERNLENSDWLEDKSNQDRHQAKMNKFDNLNRKLNEVRTQNSVWKATNINPAVLFNPKICKNTIKRVLQSAEKLSSQKFFNTDLTMFDMAKMKEIGEQTKKRLIDKKCRDILEERIEQYWLDLNHCQKIGHRYRLRHVTKQQPSKNTFEENNQTSESMEDDICELMNEHENRKSSIKLPNMCFLKTKPLQKQFNDVIIPNLDEVRQLMKFEPDLKGECSLTLLKHGQEFFVVRQAIEIDRTLSLSVHLLEYEESRFRYGKHFRELIAGRNLKYLGFDNDIDIGLNLVDYLVSEGKIYFFDFQLVNISEKDTEFTYSVQLKHLNLNSLQIETCGQCGGGFGEYNNFTLTRKLMGIQFVKRILSIDQISTAYVLMIMEKQACVRSLRDLGAPITKVGQELLMPITFYHVEAISIWREEDQGGMLYLQDMMRLIGQEVQESRKYIFLFFRRNNDVVIFVMEKHLQLVDTIKKIQLTHDQKTQLMGYWKSRVTCNCHFYKVIQPKTLNSKASCAMLQEQPQTRHINHLMRRIFSSEEVSVSTLEDPTIDQYLLLIYQGQDLSIENLNIFTYGCKVDSTGSNQIQKNLILNQYHVDDHRAKILVSRKISNLIVKNDLSGMSIGHSNTPLTKPDIENIFGQSISYSKVVTSEILSQMQISKNNNAQGGEQDYQMDPQLITIIEDSEDYHLCIIGQNQANMTQKSQIQMHKLFELKNQAIYGLKNNKIVPGIYLPLSVFGDEPTFASLSQASDPQIVYEQLWDGKNLSYSATRYAVAITKCLNQMEIIVLEFVVKKMKRDRLPASELQIDEQSANYVFRTSIIGEKTIILPHYRQRDFPSLYPMFEQTQKGALSIVGVRLQFGCQDRGTEIALPNSFENKQPTEGALTRQCISFQGKKSSSDNFELRMPQDEKVSDDISSLQQSNPPEKERAQAFWMQVVNEINQFSEDEDKNWRTLVAEVRLRPSVEVLLGTKYDPFKHRGFHYLREIFRMQIKNILNMTLFQKDPMAHVNENEFERGQINEFFQCSDILQGFSPGEIALQQQLSEQSIANIRRKLMKVKPLCREHIFDTIKKSAKQTKQSLLRTAVKQFNSKDFEDYIWESDYLLREEDFLQYDINCQSLLVATYEKSQQEGNFHNFLELLELTTLSSMRPQLKRQHLTAILKLAGHDYQDENASRRLLFPIVTFLDEQAGTDQEVLVSAERKHTGFRILLSEIPVLKSYQHLSKNVKTTDGLIAESDAYLIDVRKPILEKLQQPDYLKPGYWDKPWCRKPKDASLLYSLLDYRPLVFQRFISDLVKINNSEQAIATSTYRFSKLEVARTNRGLFRQCRSAQLELMQFQTIQDSIDALFKSEVEIHFSRLSIIFFFGHIVPLIIQILVQNDPHEEGFRSSPQAILIYFSSIISTITQMYLALLEYRSRMRQLKFKIFQDLQNIIDMSSIGFSFIYNIIRLSYPSGSLLEPGHTDIDEDLNMRFYQTMPMIHFLMILLTAGQSIFYLMLDHSRAKFLTLFWASFIDIQAFLVIFFLNIFMVAALLHVLGATFDVGGNFDSVSYDTNHNDYYLVPYFGVVMAANLRNAVDDLQTPSYNYWVEQYEISKQPSMFYVTTIWIVYFTGVLISTILALNFLIAIVSQAYENIMDRQENAIISARSELNIEYVQQVNPNPDADVEFLVLATQIGRQVDIEWSGMCRNIKKDMRNTRENLKSIIQRVQEQFETKQDEMRKEINRGHAQIVQLLKDQDNRQEKREKMEQWKQEKI